MTIEREFRCLMVRKDAEGNVSRGIETRAIEELSEGDVTVRVSHSSLNYKDALAATGHPGVARNLPHVPGIDATGSVVASSDSQFNVGDEVMVFHADFGTAAFGGYSELIRVPSDWVYRLPNHISGRSAMVYGTAGFTAAQSVDQLQQKGIKPTDGEILVTGATGGVGSFSVQMLAKLGYEVAAVTGKPEKSDWLKELGATSVLMRSELAEETKKPMLKARWAGAIDSVGGATLANVLKSIKLHGCVTACGLVAGVDFQTNVYPFILRGVCLQGIDSANIAYSERARIWERLATDLAIEKVDSNATETDLDGLGQHIETILKGGVSGRVVVKL